MKQAPVKAAGRSGFLSKRAIADRYDVTTRSVDRWKKDSKLQFPAADLVVNGREYRRISTMEKWERRRATATS